MNRPILVTALRLAAENARLKRELAAAISTTGQALNMVHLMRRESEGVVYERDEALGLVVDLRADIAALERVNRELRRSCPHDASELTDG